MRFLFWNTHNTKDINSILCGMIVEQKANIVILAEYEDIIEDLIYNLDLKGVRMNVYPSIGCDRLIILGNTKDIRQSRQSKYYSMQIIKNDMLLCAFIFRVKCGRMNVHKRSLFSQWFVILNLQKRMAELIRP